MLNERERLMREIQDSLLQNLQGLILSLQAISEDNGLPGAAKERLDAVLENAEWLLLQSRLRMQELRDLEQGERTADFVGP